MTTSVTSSNEVEGSITRPFRIVVVAMTAIYQTIEYQSRLTRFSTYMLCNAGQGDSSRCNKYISIGKRFARNANAMRFKKWLKIGGGLKRWDMCLRSGSGNIDVDVHIFKLIKLLHLFNVFFASLKRVNDEFVLLDVAICKTCEHAEDGVHNGIASDACAKDDDVLIGQVHNRFIGQRNEWSLVPLRQPFIGLNDCKEHAML